MRKFTIRLQFQGRDEVDDAREVVWHFFRDDPEWHAKKHGCSVINSEEFLEGFKRSQMKTSLSFLMRHQLVVWVRALKRVTSS